MVSDTSGSVTLTAQRALWASATHCIAHQGSPTLQAIAASQSTDTGYSLSITRAMAFYLGLGSVQEAKRPGPLQAACGSSLASHQAALLDLSEMAFKCYLENRYSLSSAASADRSVPGKMALLTRIRGPVSGKGLLS